MSLLPAPVYADTNPVEFYEDLAETVGVAIDLGSEAWENKTVAAYTAYISSYMAVSDAQSFYQSGAAIEELTGYNVVSVRDGRYYMNSCDDGAGGAMYDIDCGDPSNMAALSKETMKWIRYAATNGPDWPNGGGSGGGGGVTQDGYVIFSCTGYTTNSTSGGGTTFVIYNEEGTATGTMLSFIRPLPSNRVESPSNFSAMVPNDDVTKLEGATAIVHTLYGGRIYDVILYGEYTLSTTESNGYPNTTISYNGEALTMVDARFVQGTSGLYLKYNSVENSKITLNANNCRVNWVGTLGSGGGGAIEGDETVPSPPATPRPGISWPDITLPSLPDFNPTINIVSEGDYDPTTGVIDFTPITDRLDAINENLEYFYQSFNSFFSDFLSYMDALGDGVGDMIDQLYDINSKLRDVITWLRNIFYNMGNGGSSEPDPSTNNDGWWDWLGKLIGLLLGDLPSSLSALTSTFSGLRNLFPFCVPWDVATLLALLVSEPVTPVFDIPWGYGSSSMAYIHVDLTPWNGLAVAVRSMILLIFALGLAMRTRDMLRNAEVD